MTTCDEIRAKLADYAVGLPDEPLRAAIERHLESCSGCASELAALEKAGLLVDALELREAPGHLWDAIEGRITAESSRSGRWQDILRPAFLRKTAFAGLAAAVLVILAFLPFARPVKTVDDQAGSFIERHGMLAWNDPLSDKAALGAAVGASVAREEIP
ncbi:MAG: zf-HC2 domain-containing protein [Armatimonadetes bacterium]|nr:zf-HC2 domain-containing protein [Armatimonadota bacterium]